MSTAPVVFVGPSVTPAEVLAVLPDAVVRPPISRGDLHRARAEGHGEFLIIDGVFSQRLAVSPREVVDVLRDGAVVWGASSMGALRAADCGPAGMVGHGLVYRWYRAGLLVSDDEVAVATDPDRGFASVSVALINIRFALKRACRAALLTREEHDTLLARAAAMFFPQRTWRAVLLPLAEPRRARLQAFCEANDVKRRDALSAARRFARARVGLAEVRASHADFARVRYPGHDRMLGRSEREVEQGLKRWLFGSGRYQRWLWPLVLADGGLTRGLSAEPAERAAGLRDRLPEAIGRLLEREDVGAVLVAELEFLEELDAELMRWHAHEALAA
ncbi:MAG: hypothetical protein JNK82_32795, partial [Myxococcaceae bacterium]|nr:hypothetical protein [Myxococcaceae bacterium]